MGTCQIDGYIRGHISTAEVDYTWNLPLFSTTLLLATTRLL